MVVQDTLPTQSQPTHNIITATITPSETSKLEDLPLPQWNQIELATSKLQQRHLSGGDYPLPDSPTWTAQGEWSNVDIDEYIGRWSIIDPSIIALHSKIILDAQTSPTRVIRQFQDAMIKATNNKSNQLHIILWIRHHWIAATIEGNKMMIMDSAPGIAQEDDLRAIAEFIGTALNEDMIIIHMKVPLQPRNSNECGAHAITNLMLSSRRWLWEIEASDTAKQRISYQNLATVLQLFSEGGIRLDFIFDRILETIGEARFPLLTHSRLLAIADRWGTEALSIRWMGETQVQLWTGRLVKRAPTHWKIQYDEDDKGLLSSLPHKNVTYLSIESKNEQDILESLARTHGDLMSLNIEPPSSTSKVEGDSITMRALKNMLAGTKMKPTDKNFLAAYAQSTRQHQQQIFHMIKTAPLQLDLLMCSEGLPKMIQLMKEQRKWRASTTLSKLTSTQGALKIIPYYYKAPSVQLTNSVIWRTSLRGAQILANMEEPLQAFPATSLHIQQARMLCTSPILKAALEVAWMTAGRAGDILLLKTRGVLEVEGTLMVKFTEGKTARNGAYSVAVPLPSSETLQYIKECQCPTLFPGLEPADIKDALRKSDTRLECRSIRRGRLQELSQGGMTDASLIHVSRHASISMLRRYLDFGCASGENVRRAQLAAAAAISALSKGLTQGRVHSLRVEAEEDAHHQKTASESSQQFNISSEESFQ